MPRADFQRLGTGICAVKVKLTMLLEIEADRLVLARLIHSAASDRSGVESEISFTCLGRPIRTG